jgi:hypothetical protein
MARTILRRHMRLGIMGVLLLLSAAAFIATSGTAEAGQSICRHDPIVYLTNGTVITMITDFDVTSDKIESIVYTVKAPRGSVVDHIVYDGDPTGEQVVFRADRADTSYEVEHYATTQGHANVNATTIVNTISTQKAGHERDHLKVTIRNP